MKRKIKWVLSSQETITAKEVPRRVSPRKGNLQKATPQKDSSQKSLKKITPQNPSPVKDRRNKVTPQKSKVMQKKLPLMKLREVVENVDTDINGRQERVRRVRKPARYEVDTLSPKIKSPEKNKTVNTETLKILKTNSSLRVLKDENSNVDQDIYIIPQKPSHVKDICNKFTPQKSEVMQKKLVQKKLSEVVKNVDTDINGRQERVRPVRKPARYQEYILSPKIKCPEKNKTANPEECKILKPNSSLRVLKDKNSNVDRDIYVTPQKPSPVKGRNKVTPQKGKVMQKKLLQKKLSKVVENVDTDINGRPERVRRVRKPAQYAEDTLSPKIKSPEKNKTGNSERQKILKTNASFRILEDNISNVDRDIYEFTFDPTEEPQPQKKKRKKFTAKKPSKPKTRVCNNNYEKNIARALADLKNIVKQKPGIKSATTTLKQDSNKVVQGSNKTTMPALNPSSIVINTVAEIHHNPTQSTPIRSSISTKHVSYRVEDIAADFNASIDHEINYSPVNSPHRIETEAESCPIDFHPEQVVRPEDPLNLHDNLSFFDDQPIANSSMNTPKNPTATPWRAEFQNLPIKWQANTYVKSDMTPALECSYVNNFDDCMKKHVYTDLVADSNDALPEIEDEAPKLKQTSIISFIKEVVEKKSNKKMSGTPKKANSSFDMCNEFGKTQKSDATPMKETSNTSNISENEVVESNKTQKRKHDTDNNPTPAKIVCKDKENTLFGFDDSENQDQENVSPIKVSNNRLKSLRSRSRAVLKELNEQNGPMRAEFPVAMKAKLLPSSEVVGKIYDQMKSAADAPMILDVPGDTAEVTNIEMAEEMEDDDQSVHLFEDIELVHHLKPTRKSYGKAKKVTFQNSNSASDDEAPRHQSSDDDLEDLSFHLPEIKARKAKKKKVTKKQALSKKEKAEVDAWAACFNSMCEDIEEFPLVVE